MSGHGKTNVLMRRLRRRLTVLILVVLIPALLLIGLFYRQLLSISMREFTKNMDLTLGQIDSSLSHRLNNVNSIQDLIATNENIGQYLSANSQEETLYQQVLQFQEMTAFLLGFYTNRDISHIALYVEDSKLYANQRDDFRPISELKALPIYKTLLQNPGRPIWGDVVLDDSGEYRVPCYRVILNIGNMQEIAGVSVIELKERSINESLSATPLDGCEELLLTDNGGNVLSSEDHGQIRRPYARRDLLQGLLGQRDGYLEFRNGETRCALFTRRLSENDWYIVSRFKVDKVIRQSVIFGSLASVMGLLFFVVASLFLVIVALGSVQQYMIEQVERICRNIELSGVGHPEVKDAGRKVIGRLDERASALIRTVHNQTAQLYEKEIRLRDEHLKALQAQINPHFLYNTLDAINWMAIRRHAPDVSFMLEKLAAYFRFSLNRGREFVTIHDELELVRAYVQIQLIRFENNFDVVYHVAKEAEQCLIPKLVLQPIVENALVHGFNRESEQKGIIQIIIAPEKDNIRIRIQDNGVGIPDDILLCLRKSVRHYETGEHYGLANICERLRIFSAERHAFEIHSESGKGTCIDILLKMKTTVPQQIL